MAARLKVQLVFLLSGQPRGCGQIERFFSTVHQLLSSELASLRSRQRVCFC